MRLKSIILTLSAALTAVSMVLPSCTKQEGGSAVDDWEDIFHKEEPEDPEEPEEPVDTTGREDPPAPEFKKTTDLSGWFQMRGIQPSWDDVKTPDVLDYVDICIRTGINTISVFPDYTSEVGKEFMKRCEEAGIDVEYENHQMSNLLPRNLFETHPNAFRMDEAGNRNPDGNACASSAEGLEIIARNAVTMAKRQKPSNHRYYCWFDDSDVFCHCPECSKLTPSEQALLIENAIIKAIRKEDPEALLAHLSYGITYSAPVKVKPEEGVFLEFAPIDRSRYHPLSDTWVEANRLGNNAKALQTLSDNLKVFPAETAMVLEYWMDESMFCGWNPNKLVSLYWDKALFLSDLRTYASYGIRNIESYCYYVGADYVRQFGHPSFLEDYGNGLYEFVK